MRLAALVLAAGASSRMGRPKALLPVPGGGTLLAAATRPFLDAGLDAVIVVLGAYAAAVRAGAGLPPDPRLRVVENDAWREGQASSLRAGLAACANADAVLISLGDLHGLDAARVRRVLDAWRGEPLVVPEHDGRPTHPVLVARELFAELRELGGDVGAREVVARHRARGVLLEEPPLLDLDTPQDHRTLLADRPAPPD